MQKAHTYLRRYRLPGSLIDRVGVYASIDLGGTKIAGALATEDGQVLAQRIIATESHAGPPAVLARIARLVEEMAAEVGVRPLALGMGVPGLADLEQGVVKFLQSSHTVAQCRRRRVFDTGSGLLGAAAQRCAYGCAGRTCIWVWRRRFQPYAGRHGVLRLGYGHRRRLGDRRASSIWALSAQAQRWAT